MLLAVLTLIPPPQDAACARAAADVRAAERVSIRPNRGPSPVQLTMIPPFCNGWTVIDIVWERTEPQARKGVVLRRQRSDGLRSVSVEWTDDRSCPTVRPMVDALNRMTLTVSLDSLKAAPSPGIRPSPPPPPPPDDGIMHRLRLWSSRQPDGSAIQMETSSNYGPVVKWAERYLPQIESCWTPLPA